MAHPDLDQLLNFLLPFAKQQLEKHGDFLPFGASIKADGSLAPAMAYTEAPDATVQDLIALMEKGFEAAAKAGEIRALGLCIDSRVVPPGETAKSDAICCSLEHECGEAGEVFLPYRKGLFGRLKYGELFAIAAAPKTFDPNAAI